MTSNQPEQSRLPFPRWWTYYATVVSAVAIVGLILGVVGIYANNRQDAQADAEARARDADTKALLKCFDDFASDLSGGLPPVREATAATNDALSGALSSLQVGLVKVGTGTFKPSDLDSIIAAFDNYQHANDHLIKVREDNPYPPPPSTFCATR